MIIELLYLILFTSLSVLGFKIITSKDMLLEQLGNYIEFHVEQGKKYFELLRCCFCMPTLFSLAGWGFVFVVGILPFTFNLKYVALHILTVLGSSLVCGLTWTWYIGMNAKREFYEAAEQYHQIARKHYENKEQLSFWKVKSEREEHNKKRSVVKSYQQ